MTHTQTFFGLILDVGRSPGLRLVVYLLIRRDETMVL
jgi:hypothetical protein